MTLVIDQEAEDAIFAELEGLGTGLTAISEERGRVEIAGGGPLHVVIDPIDGSLNAKRGLPFHAVSIAVASGTSMADVDFGLVHDLGSGEQWWAHRGRGAFLDGRRLPQLDAEASLELLALETAHPPLVAAIAERIAQVGAHRMRVIGSIALAMTHLAAGRLDAMISLRPIRSVDAAAAQLIVREVGGTVVFPDVGASLEEASLGLDMRSRVCAAGGPRRVHELVDQLLCPQPSAA